ncbi:MULTISPECIES: TAXI family TRAP transporter solute-binding subunit [Jutongia]|jgi:TRAP transporter TAXI family solute receptor|uniref:TAXI family TRAP transporter solute-binding subunit n=1 Tax=Jutongia huaianensis TaxID=2763668 RepID=A0ABR7MXG4_9FIRM|nr:TAXI family TRAP transporter solute-binding subunit [Jutongia huaianensis]MBC8561070.1 TAXI family TRAP transporter solute-binding subunit [Jutongia huaianensis]
MKKVISILTCLCLLMTTGCSRQETIRFGAAGVGGMYYPFANAFTELASKDETGINWKVKSTAGSAANLRLLSDNYIELGIAQADLIEDAYYGKGSFHSGKYRGYKAVASLYPEACQIVVRKDSDITSLDDLEGKNVSVGEEESGTERNATQILEMCGLPDNLVNTKNLDYTDAADQLAEKKIDAFFCTAGICTTVIEELTKECDIRLLEIPESCRQKLKKAYSFYDDYVIPAGTYSGQTEDIQTISVQSVLLASSTLSEKTVQKLTASLFKHIKDIQYSISINLQLTPQEAVKGITIPFHPGAETYYKLEGVELPEVES